MLTPFINSDYLGVNPSVVSARKAFLRNLWEAIAPELELQYGVYNSTVAAPTAIFSQAIIDSIDKWREHSQIQSLVENVRNDPEINTQYLDLFLANYRIRRLSGENSVGLVRLLFNANTMYSFGGMDTFLANGQTFHPTAIFTIYPAGQSAHASNSQPLQQLDNGLFSAVIELRSSQVDIAANLPVGTKLIPQGSQPSSLLEVEVIETFVGGIQEDTVEMLVPQLVNGITSPVLTSRANIGAWIKTVPNTVVKEASVIGAGDIESIRDKHGLFNLSQGGAGDIYVRTADSLLTKAIQVRGVLVDEGTLTYRIELGRDDAPAAYSILGVYSQTSSTALEVTNETRGIDLTGINYAPDVINYREGAFTAFQTIVLEFVDHSIDPTCGTIPEFGDYTIFYDYLPYIPELQDFVLQRDNIAVMGDLLVKAAIPCKTLIDFSIAIQQGQTLPELSAIKSAAVNAVANTGFMNVLPASIIIEAVQRLLPAGMFVSDFYMAGSLLLPIQDNQTYSVTNLKRTASSAKEELAFELPPHATVNTICFFTDTNSVNVTFKEYRSVARFTN